jgi:ppGpp synthetase/RelA/SpoT-type nucleotidyltranferase
MPIEIQVRTELQHVWAQLSEKLSDVVDPTVKYGGGDPDTQDILARFSKIIASFEEKESVASAAELVGELGQFLTYAIERWTRSPKSEGGS